MKSRAEYSERKFMNTINDNAERAKAFLDDDDKMEELFRKFEEKLKMIPKVGDKASELAVMLSMVRAYSKKQYTAVPTKTILFCIGAIIYIVYPFDLIPDYVIGFGQMDDILVIGLLLRTIHPDLVQYKRWQEMNGKR